MTRNKLDYQHTHRRRLPHIQPPGATLFVTYRLFGSLPIYVLQALEQEASADQERVLAKTMDEYEAEKRRFGRWDRALDDEQSGPHWLRRPEVAELVVESLQHLDGEKYELMAVTVMSNHVHVVFTPLEIEDGKYYALSRIMHSLKGYTAVEGNKVLGREGQFWQHESYDHIVRDEEELRRIVRYVVNNPVKAGLVESWEQWPWTYSRYPPYP